MEYLIFIIIIIIIFLGILIPICIYSYQTDKLYQTKNYNNKISENSNLFHNNFTHDKIKYMYNNPDIFMKSQDIEIDKSDIII